MSMDLTIGPIAFFWTAGQVADFYRAVAQGPASRVVIGEWVCSKRLPFWQHEIPAAVNGLLAAGKEVALSTLALITLRRERRQTEEMLDTGLPVEVADLSALHHLPEGAPFWVGPTVNVYNEGTLDWLARRGATRICLSPQTGDFAALTGFYADLLAAPRPGAQEALRRLLPGAELAQGFLDGRAGVAGA